MVARQHLPSCDVPELMRSRKPGLGKIDDLAGTTIHAGAYRKFARKVRLGGGCEGSGFLVSHVPPINLALAANRVCEPIEAITHDFRRCA